MRPAREPRPARDPILKVAGVCSGPVLSNDIDRDLYGVTPPLGQILHVKGTDAWAFADLSGTSWGSASSTRRRFSLQFDLIVINGGSNEIF